MGFVMLSFIQNIFKLGIMGCAVEVTAAVPLVGVPLTSHQKKDNQGC